MAVLDFDLRRTDQRTNVRINPFWVKSAEITAAMMDAAAANEISGLFSFPAALGDFWIHEVVCQIVTAFDGTTPTIDIGLYTLDDITIDLSWTEVDTDRFVDSTEIDVTTPAYYVGVATAFAAARTTTPLATTLSILGVDTVTPCITADLLCAAQDVTTGSAYVYVMMSRIQ